MNHGYKKKKKRSDKQVNKVPRCIRGREGVIIWIIFACLINIYCLLGNRHCWVLLHLLFYLITKSSSLADKISQGLPWANELACLVFLRPSCSWRSPRERQGHLVLRLPPLGSCLPAQGWLPAAVTPKSLGKLAKSFHWRKKMPPWMSQRQATLWSSAAEFVAPWGIHPAPVFLCLSPIEWGGERGVKVITEWSRLTKRFPKCLRLISSPTLRRPCWSAASCRWLAS